MINGLFIYHADVNNGLEPLQHFLQPLVFCVHNNPVVFQVFYSFPFPVFKGTETIFQKSFFLNFHININRCM